MTIGVIERDRTRDLPLTRPPVERRTHQLRATRRIACRDCAFFVIIPPRFRVMGHQPRGSLMRVRSLPLILSGIVAAGLAVSGCAAPGAPGAAQTASAADDFNDPWEDTNRGVFAFTKAVDETVLVPVAKTYPTVLPPPIRQSLHDSLHNLIRPHIFRKYLPHPNS